MLIAVAMLVFNVQVIGSWLALGVTVTLGALAHALARLRDRQLRAKRRRSRRSLTFLISFPMMFLGGSYFPTDSAPAFLAPVINRCR